MTHLLVDERLALIEATGEPRHPHLADCARCRAEVASARETLAESRLADVPEPSPLFWEHFSARVAESLAAAPEPSRGSWVGWRVMGPLTLGVVALVMTVLVDWGPAVRQVRQAANAVVIDNSAQALPVVEDDEQWNVLSHLAGEFDLETLSDSLGKSGTVGAESVVWQLNEQERVELARLLSAELRQGTSGS